MIRQRRFFAYLLVGPVALVLALAGCGLYSPVEVREISSWHDVELDFKGMQAEFEVTVHNPNFYRLTVADVAIEVLMDGKQIGEASLGSGETVVLPAGEEAVVSLAVRTVDGGGAALVRHGAEALFGAAADMELELRGIVRVRGMGLTKEISIRHNESLKLN